MIRIAVDTGGTFTDVVATDFEKIVVGKVRSRPDAPDEAVAAAIEKVRAAFPGDAQFSLTHGTTVATNALLEQGGAETWFVTNRGFEDLLAIGRQHRNELYALEPQERVALVQRSQTIGAIGRRDRRGEVVEALDIGAFQRALHEVPDAPTPRSWAICLLHSYANGDDERALARCINERFPEDYVSMSHVVMPEFREVERAGTTVANAHVAPLMDAYLRRIEALVARVDVMGSSGGRLSVGHAADIPVHTALSGPAGGVVAAMAEASLRGWDGVLSFDMGGTSTDVALCLGQLPIKYDGQVGPFPVHVPMLDIHTVGAGGGSIASVDDGGALRVGPASAGADPGPACYGSGERPTVTDANVVLGRMPEDVLLAGDIPISAERARSAIKELARLLGVDMETAAKGVIDIAVEHMAGAIRKVSVERGIDPRSYPLCAFGGAGGLHACDLADRLGVRTVLVPSDGGLLSARGMLQSDARVSRSVTVLGRQPEERAAAWSQLTGELKATLGDECEIDGFADCRYRGQSFELTIPFQSEEIGADTATLAERFAEEHAQRFGYDLDAPLELVTLRAEGVASDQERLGVDVGRSDEIRCEHTGPASIVRMSTTVYVARGWAADEYGDGTLELRREGESNGRD